MLIQADSTKTLPLGDETVQCVVTSPPYWGLRNYQVAGQMGLEPTVGEYIDKMVAVFREVWRVLKPDGVVWLNMGDAYNSHEGQRKAGDGDTVGFKQATNVGSRSTPSRHEQSLKAKDLIGMPWRVAFALQAAGWWLRSDVVWHKPNPMPDSVTDRPTRSHEYLFLLTKRARYYYDAEAIRERGAWKNTRERTPAGWRNGTRPMGELNPDGHSVGRYDAGRDPIEARKARASADHKSAPTRERNGIRARHAGGDARATNGKPDKQRGHSRWHAGFNERWDARTVAGQAELTAAQGGRNKRDVWTIPTMPCPEAHFATFPEKLVEPCVLAGSRPGDVVLDIFGGTGTVERVAYRLGRKGVALELSGEYLKIARKLARVPKKNQMEICHG